jgi:hypothetical protein
MGGGKRSDEHTPVSLVLIHRVVTCLSPILSSELRTPDGTVCSEERRARRREVAAGE